MTTTYPHHKTTIDQHRGNHEPTGLPIFQLHDIVTDFADLSQDSWDELDTEAQQWWCDVIADYHDACVALESLDAAPRSRAREILLESGADDVEDCAGTIRRAIAEATDPDINPVT